MNATTAALAVAFIASAHIAYMSRSSGQVSTAHKLAMQSATQFAILSQLAERLKDREVLLESANAAGNVSLAACLRTGVAREEFLRSIRAPRRSFLAARPAQTIAIIKVVPSVNTAKAAFQLSSTPS